MIDLTGFPVAILFVFLVCLWWRKKRHPLFPPGYTGIPIFGVAPYITEEPCKVFKKWSLEKFGPIMSARIIYRDVVILNTFEVVHQAFVKQSAQFSGRAYNPTLSQHGGNNGLGLKDYDPAFKTQKHFALKTLRGFGFGRKGMEDIIKTEAGCLITFFEKHCDTQTFSTKEWLFRAAVNIIAKMAMSMRIDYEDKSYDKILDHLKRLFGDEADGDMIGLMNICDILRFFPPFSGAHKRFGERDQTVLDFLRKRLNEHKQDFDPENPRDFVDVYLNEQRSGTGKNADSFTDDQLIFSVREFFVAGTEIVSGVLSWLIIILLRNPQYYEKMQEEIDLHAESDEILSMSLLKSMPFTSAMIQEVHRSRTAAPASMIHKTLQDSELGGYIIPKGTRVVANLWGVHNDPKAWPNPEKFDPYRHIDQDGKFVPSNKIIPFSVGPRFCLGESLARAEIFIFLSKLLKNFTILPDENGLPSLDGFASIVYHPFDFQVKLQKRN